MSMYVVRAFVRLRTLLEGNAQLDADTRVQFKDLRAVAFSLASPPVREQ